MGRVFPHVPTCASSLGLFPRYFTSLGDNACVDDNRQIKVAARIPLDELEDNYMSYFFECFGVPAKPFCITLEILIIKAHLRLTDEELVEQIKVIRYPQCFISLEAFQYTCAFDHTLIDYFR